MPALDWQLVSLVAVVVASFTATRIGGLESRKLLQALHRRFDEFTREMRAEVTELKVKTGKLDERTSFLRNTQRFRIRAEENKGGEE